MTDVPSHGQHEPARSQWAQFFDSIEETIMAFLLGGMTLITFANVVARYVFNDNILWALELSVFMFAWLVLLGASYGVKKNLHIGVDIVIKSVPLRVSQVLCVLAWLACLAFALLMLKGAWDYWQPFATEQAWYETNDIPMPQWLQFMSDHFNEGERYEKIPKFLPYMVLPISMALLVFRFIQAGWDLLHGRRSSLIASHEAEAALEELPATEQPQHAASGGR